MRRSLMLISVGWVPPYWYPSRRLLRSRHEGLRLATLIEGCADPGAASPPMTRGHDPGRPSSLLLGPGRSYAGRGTVRAMAHANAAISRAIATTT
jgi:hypothetical protein